MFIGKKRDFSLDSFHSHYEELVSRNRHFVPQDLQEKLKYFKILIAGCGSTGGACIEALARVGVCQFALADNGAYDVSNLNRQHARMENIGQNKARFHENEILNINPHAEIYVEEEGIQARNVEELVSWADFIFDAVDVTTNEGIEAKILLHEKCHKYKKPVLAGLDLGYLQWGCSYDYRNGNLKILKGTAHAARQAKHPIAALFEIYPLNIVPSHCIQLLEDLLLQKSPFASQMGCTSDALSAVIVPAVLRYLENGTLISGWKVDLTQYRYSHAERIRQWVQKRYFHHKIKKIIKAL